MRDTALVYPKMWLDHHERRSTESVDELIEKGIINQKDRKRYIDFYREQLYSESAFQGGVLKSLKAKSLLFLEKDVAKYEAIPVGILSICEMNAFAIRTPRGGCAIALYKSLWAYLKIAFYSLLAIIYRKSPRSIGTHHTNETYAINFYSVVNAIKSGSLIVMLKDGEHSIADVVGDASRPDHFVAQNMDFALTFILLHEYGHIYHGHLDENLTRRMSSEGENIDIYLTSHEQEYEADEFAARKLFRKGEEHLIHNVCYILAITLLFLLFDFCEDDDSSRILGTHPSSVNRLKRIYAVCNDLCGNSSWIKMKEATDYVEIAFKILRDYKSSYA